MTYSGGADIPSPETTRYRYAYRAAGLERCIDPIRSRATPIGLKSICKAGTEEVAAVPIALLAQAFFPLIRV
jgi:hypothetical protein